MNYIICCVFLINVSVTSLRFTLSFKSVLILKEKSISKNIFFADGSQLPLYEVEVGGSGHSLSETVKVLSDILTVASIEAKKGDQEGIMKRRLQIGMQNLVHFRNVDGSFSEPFDNGRKIG